jgi:hypothetical protein
MINSHLARALAEARMADLHRDVRRSRRITDAGDGPNRRTGRRLQLNALLRAAVKFAR